MHRATNVHVHQNSRPVLEGAAYLDLRDAGAGAGSAPGQERRVEAVSARAVLGSACSVHASPALGPHALRLRPVPRRSVQGVQGHLSAYTFVSVNRPMAASVIIVWHVIELSPVTGVHERVCRGICQHTHDLHATIAGAASCNHQLACHWSAYCLLRCHMYQRQDLDKA